jgi:xanthine dehydrogenase iron-sulfur cluster and FAD-binding subunit A
MCASQTEAYLRGKSLRFVRHSSGPRQVFDKEIAPIDDIRSTAHYRRVVALNLLEEFLTTTAAQ